jgi:hypothetical protein
MSTQSFNSISPKNEESVFSTYDINQKEPEGTFGWHPDPFFSMYLIEDAYNAVNTTNGAKQIFEQRLEDESFMFTPYTGPIWDEIHKKMDYEGHSGSSYAWTMRNIEYIFKKGWDAWVYMVKKSYIDNL